MGSLDFLEKEGESMEPSTTTTNDRCINSIMYIVVYTNNNFKEACTAAMHPITIIIKEEEHKTSQITIIQYNIHMARIILYHIIILVVVHYHYTHDIYIYIILLYYINVCRLLLALIHLTLM